MAMSLLHGMQTVRMKSPDLTLLCGVLASHTLQNFVWYPITDMVGCVAECDASFLPT